MNWKKKIALFEKKKKWQEAVEFMRHVIQQNPNNMDAHISLIFLFSHLAFALEEQDMTQFHYYSHLAQQYFQKSYTKFSDNAEYLFFASFAVISAGWFFDCNIDQINMMMKKAIILAPNNILYKFNIRILGIKAQESYAKIILDPKSQIQTFLRTKGFPGREVLGSLIGWAQIRVLTPS